ncbi:hypothetical protein [Sphingobium cloacae]|uniref:MobA-like NTP transferase domain-containing protein n=1 Tax=Sphingobium cloacae TaxID=120107 RepID=A0A1E1F0Z1_9SPHN|nr:hypothetical protein [Sphingobium cloacae]BAV64185.1 hypothetical protein SCLO_1011450 [Sphingobium cloacae]
MTFAAILSASRASGDSPAGLRATLHFAGQTLVEYQARQAARAGADRIFILVNVITPAISQAVDRLGADGIAVALVRDMVALVRDMPRDADSLLVADGAIISQSHFDALAGAEGDALLVTDDSRASAPFERIDAGQRWAGLARVSPDLLFGTLDMIGDWDLALTLVRGAVQQGVRRTTVPQDDLLEGRVALVEGQPQADLVAQSVLSMTSRSGRTRGGVEHYLFGPVARLLGPALMRSQVPALQVRIASMMIGAIALVPIELDWPIIGFCLLLFALLLSEVSDRLDELALRTPPSGWIAFITPFFALLGLAIASGSITATYLALMLAILLLADRWRRTGGARAWMIFTPGTALLLLLLAMLLGEGMSWMLDIAMICAIGSMGAIILLKRG